MKKKKKQRRATTKDDAQEKNRETNEKTMIITIQGKRFTNREKN